MSQLRLFVDLGSIQDKDQFQSAVANVMNQIQVIVNGQLEFDKNLLTQTITYKADSTDPIGLKHRLSKTGCKFIVVDADGPGILYHVKARDTLDTIYLKSTVANVTYSVVIF